MIAVLIALTIAFPRAGQQLPYVERCYMIGAVEPGTTNIVVQGKDVPVYRTGAWATVLDCAEGTNTVNVAGSNHWFTVKRRPVAVKRAQPSTNRPPQKVWNKLPYAGDAPKPHPDTNFVVTVVIDAGHGGEDSGALSPHGIWEKDANLRMAKSVRNELVRRGCRVIMTREGDTFEKLYDRPKIAHTNDAVAFISIHHNAPPYDRDPNLFRYTAVYVWNDLGAALGEAINKRMAAVMPEVKNNGVPRANYAVTRNPEIPSCLIEVDFITNPEGEESSWNPKRRQRVASAIADGFFDWLAKPRARGSCENQ